MEDHLLAGYERAVASLIAHASIHAPHMNDEPLRENILRGERSFCDRCLHLREALVAAATHWRKAAKRRRRADVVGEIMDASTSLSHLGLTG